MREKDIEYTFCLTLNKPHERQVKTDLGVADVVTDDCVWEVKKGMLNVASLSAAIDQATRYNRCLKKEHVGVVCCGVETKHEKAVRAYYPEAQICVVNPTDVQYDPGECQRDVSRSLLLDKYRSLVSDACLLLQQDFVLLEENMRFGDPTNYAYYEGACQRVRSLLYRFHQATCEALVGPTRELRYEPGDADREAIYEIAEILRKVS